MNCEQALEAISAAMDGEISQAEQAALSEHLLRCEECRALAEDFGVLTAALDDSDREAPDDLARSVMDAVAAEEKRLVKKRRPALRPWLNVAAALALVLCAAWGARTLLSGAAGSNSAMEAYSGGSTPSASSAPSAGRSSESSDGCTPADNFNCDSENQEWYGMVGAFDPQAPQSQKVGDPSSSLQPAPEDPTSASEGFNAPGAPPSWPEEPMDYAFQNVQALQVAGDGTAEEPTARVLGSVQSLHDFIEAFPESDLEAQLAGYDAGYFRSSRLLAVVVTGDSAASYDIRNVSYYFDPEPQGTIGKQVEVVRIVLEGEADDMAAWLILAEVDAMFEDGEVLHVVLKD